jgi:hypothetical protein
MERRIERLTFDKIDEGKYEEYQKSDKQTIPGFFHTAVSMKFGVSESCRRSIEKGQLCAIFNNVDAALKLYEILYCGSKDSVKALYGAINQVFQDEVIRYNWITLKAAAKELCVSVEIINIFARNGLLRSIIIKGKKKINGADVKRVSFIKEDFPEDFQSLKEAAIQCLEGRKDARRVLRTPEKVICRRDYRGKVPVSRKDNVYQIALTEPSFRASE